MTTEMNLTVAERLTQLLKHLGLSQAHFAARFASDRHA